MTESRYYSPRLERDLISTLYHQAKAESIPMTTLASRLIREGLKLKKWKEPSDQSYTLAEDSPLQNQT